MSASDDCEKKILAYIAPRRPETPEQKAAVEAAAAAQAAYESGVSSALGAFGAVDGVSALSNNGVSVNFAAPRGGRLSPANIAPVALAELKNAGLLAGYMPEARRLP